MTRAVQINLKQRINSALNNAQMVIYQNGFTRTSLSATVTRVSNVVEENVFLFFTSSRLPIPVHSVTHCPTHRIMSIAMLSASSKHWINVLRFTLYHVEGPLKLHWHVSWLSAIQLSFSKEYSHAPKMSQVGYLTLVTGRMWLISY